MIYDINGNVLYNSSHSEFSDNIELDYGYDSTSNVNYTILRIFQTKKDGTKQYPFVRCPGRMTTANLMNTENWLVAINAGLGINETQAAALGRGSTYVDLIDGIAIENGIAVAENPAEHHAGAIPLTINASGVLSTAAADATATSLVSSGTVSAICGFCPIIENYTNVSSFPTVSNVDHFSSNAQRTIIGQFGNDDYALLVCAGRSSDNSDGWTLAEAQVICQKLGLKFAYNLDGGTSTSMYLRKHPIYDFMSSTERVVPSFIVFNGTSTYNIPT